MQKHGHLGINKSCEDYRIDEIDTSYLQHNLDKNANFYNLSRAADDLFQKEYWYARVLHGASPARHIINDIMDLTKRSPKVCHKNNSDPEQEMLENQILNVDSDISMDANPCKWVSLCVIVEDIFLSLSSEDEKKVFIWVILSSDLDFYLKKLNSTRATFQKYFDEVEQWVKQASISRNDKALNSKIFSDDNFMKYSGFTRHKLRLARTSIKEVTKKLW